MHYTVDEKQRSVLLTEDGWGSGGSLSVWALCLAEAGGVQPSRSEHATRPPLHCNSMPTPHNNSIPTPPSYEAVEDVLQVSDLYDPRTQWASYIVNAIKVGGLPCRW